jgi:hypothetical protein
MLVIESSAHQVYKFGFKVINLALRRTITDLVAHRTARLASPRAG